MACATFETTAQKTLGTLACRDIWWSSFRWNASLKQIGYQNDETSDGAEIRTTNFQMGDGNEVFIGLQKNDDSYGIPHGTLNKKQTSNQQDSPHLPKFSNKTNLSIRIDVSP